MNAMTDIVDALLSLQRVHVAHGIFEHIDEMLSFCLVVVRPPRLLFILERTPLLALHWNA